MRCKMCGARHSFVGRCEKVLVVSDAADSQNQQRISVPVAAHRAGVCERTIRKAIALGGLVADDRGPEFRGMPWRLSVDADDLHLWILAGMPMRPR